MGVLSVDSGSFTAVVSSDNALSQQTGSGIYQLTVDLENMASGDEVEIRVETKCKSDQDRKNTYVYNFSDAQAVPIWVSDPVAVFLGGEIAVTLLQSAGTGRGFVWNLLIM